MPWKETNTVTLREEFILKALGKQKPFTALCEEYGISRKTGYKWMERFRQGGLPALHDESRRPRNNPNAVREEVVCELIRIKRTIPSIWGPKKVLEIYRCRYGASEEISLSSVKRILDHAGFVLHRRRPRQGGMARIQEGIVPKAANELWTVDFKGWWKTRDHSRCEPLTVRDGFSRFLLDLRVMESTTSEEVRTAFERLFKKYGLPEAIRSDNGPPFASCQAPLGLSRLSSWWVSLGIRLDRIAPGRPDQNGGHERIHRDIRAELQADPAENLEESQELFDQWRHTFNWHRPHEALHMKRPGELYETSQRVYDSAPVDISYPPNWLERRVDCRGRISLCSGKIQITTALNGYIVGLQPVGDRLDVHFDYLRIGHIDLHVLRFVPVIEKKKRGRSSSGRPAARRSQGESKIVIPNGQPTQKVLPMS